MRRFPFWAAASLAAAACLSPVDTPGSKVPGSCEFELPTVPPQQTDILFVIDNSGSMAQEQEAVATELSAFVDTLRAGNAGIGTDFQVGVITTSVYQYSPGLPPELVYLPYPRGALTPVPGTSERILTSTDPQLVEKFAQLVRRGTGGSGQEATFEAIRLGLSPPLINETNAGFLRDGARLLIVVVTDEDDCSEEEALGTAFPPEVGIGADTSRNYCREQEAKLTPVERYFALFRGLEDSRGRLRDVAYASIAPVARSDKRAEEILDGAQVRNADCPTSFQPGYRHFQMAKLFDPALQNLDSICNASFQQSLERIARLATVNQLIEVNGVPDPALLQVVITRAGGTVQVCTTFNGGIAFEEPVEGSSGRILFQPACLRRSDDERVEVKLFCAG